MTPSVLGMLQQILQQPGGTTQPLVPEEVLRQRQRDYALQMQQAYPEGAPLPWANGLNPLMEQELAARDAPQRDRRLPGEIATGRMYGPDGSVIGEGDWGPGWGAGQRGYAYPSPLNQMLGRLPGMGLY
jgi:hypothetical protein